MTTAETGRSHRLQIMVDSKELELIDEWRFKHKMPSRAAAVRELMRMGIEHGASPAEYGAKTTDFHVTPPNAPSPCSPDEGHS